MSAVADEVIRQHLIDPAICIRCNTCEEACPVGAITHDERNYVVKPDVCEGCMACVPPCPTGAIDNWIRVLKSDAWSIDEQFTWDELPEEAPLPVAAAAPSATGVAADSGTLAADAAAEAKAVLAEAAGFDRAESTAAAVTKRPGSTVKPWSAAHPYVNLYGPKNPVTATVVGNYRITEADASSVTHHVVLDFGTMPFPVLEGQSIGIIAPGADAWGKPHHPRQYSVASPRNGERPGYNNLALTVKRVTSDHDGRPVHGVCSNYVCDLKKGDTVQVTGPFGTSFLMPNHPRSNLLMICTGTGSAPMRAMTEYRRRLHASGRFESGRLMLFFGARTERELPYFGPLMKLPRDFIDVNLAFSRMPDQPKRYVQDLLRERAGEVLALLQDEHTCVYVCGLKSMEEGVLDALRDAAAQGGVDWSELAGRLSGEGRLHLETY